ncbi:MAG: hypothetical protein M3063_04540 [Actinomycetota bacterium]|nr:hypothetical protein [Actinomycetota bacterium]
MVGVSVPALRRWRHSDLPTGENRRAIAQLLAFVQIISEDQMIFGPVSWMEVPVVGGAPTTRIDLYAAGHLDVVFDLATQHCPPEAAMDAAEPGWQERYRSDWETVPGADGQPYIRLKPKRVNLDTYAAPGRLYIARGDEVNPNRPLFTRDVFANVAIPGVEDQEMAMIVAHPCSFRAGAGVRL